MIQGLLDAATWKRRAIDTVLLLATLGLAITFVWMGGLDALFNGISIGAVLLIAALGLAIVFGLMGVINMAHGELMMFGAYTTFVVQNVAKQVLPEFKPPEGAGFGTVAIAFLQSRDMYIFYALIAAFLVAALIGFALERGVIRFLYGRPLETLLATWGVSLILRQYVRSANGLLTLCIALFSILFLGSLWFLSKRANWLRIRGWAIFSLLLLSLGITLSTGVALGKNPTLTKLWFGTRNIDVTAPAWLRGGIAVGTLQFPYARLFIIGLTLLCLVAIYWFLQKTAWGLRIRAVTQNRTMSACLGIPTQTVDGLTFAIGSGLAGIAGCAVTLLGPAGPNLGGTYIVDAFMVVVVGGVGKLVGSIAAALMIGTLNYLIGAGTIVQVLTSPLSSSLKPLIESGQSPADALASLCSAPSGFGFMSLNCTLINLFNFFATTSMAKVLVFALIIVFLQFRPSGMFPQKGRTVDA